MGTTPTYALPYPELSDSANVPRDNRALAEATEAAIAGLKQPHCDLVATAVQSMASSSEVLINLGGGTQDPAGMWTSGSNVKILVAGLYQIIVTYSWAANASGSRIVLIKVNGATVRGWNVAGAGVAANIGGTITLLRRCAVNDLIALAQYQSSGVALNTFNQAYPGIALSRLGA